MSQTACTETYALTKWTYPIRVIVTIQKLHLIVCFQAKGTEFARAVVVLGAFWRVVFVWNLDITCILKTWLFSSILLLKQKLTSKNKFNIEIPLSIHSHVFTKETWSNIKWRTYFQHRLQELFKENSKFTVINLYILDCIVNWNSRSIFIWTITASCQ